VVGGNVVVVAGGTVVGRVAAVVEVVGGEMVVSVARTAGRVPVAAVGGRAELVSVADSLSCPQPAKSSAPTNARTVSIRAVRRRVMRRILQV